MKSPDDTFPRKRMILFRKIRCKTSSFKLCPKNCLDKSTAHVFTHRGTYLKTPSKKRLAKIKIRHIVFVQLPECSKR